MLSSTMKRKAMLGLAAAMLFVAATVFAQDWDPAPVAGAEEAGDKSLVPIVFVHGQNGAGDQFERQSMHFTSNGYPASWIVPFDYNTAVRSARGARGAGGEGPRTSTTTEPLDKLIDEVRKRTGHDKINLIGHSRGTFESGTYLSDPARAAKIAHYVSIGGGPATNPNGVPSLAVSGLGDFGRGPSASNGGRVAWMPAYQDHVMVCTSDESFWEVYTFLNSTFGEGEGQDNIVKPKHLRIVPEEKPQVAGYVKSYIHNKPLAGAKVEVWEVEPATGQRMKQKPLITLAVDELGKWGPFSAKPGQPYEFVVHGTAAPIPPRFFRSPFTHSDRFVYFRIAADAEDYTPSPFSRAPEVLTEKTATFIVRHQNGSLVPGAMTLKINGEDLIRPEILPATTAYRQAATVALYLTDGNLNGKSEFKPVDNEAFRGAFVSSADVAIPADAKKSVEFRLNDHVINVPALSGKEAGPISVVFENFD